MAPGSSQLRASYDGLTSNVINIIVQSDLELSNRAPLLSVNEPLVQTLFGETARIIGTTELTAVLTINSTSTRYDANGAFTFEENVAGVDSVSYVITATHPSKPELFTTITKTFVANTCTPEVCNGVDDDCDDIIDNNFADFDKDGIADCVDQDDDNDGIEDEDDCNPYNAESWQTSQAYLDADNDGFGTSSLLDICMGDSIPSGYSENNFDCDDSRDGVYPGATEICNGLDDDCNVVIDEGFPDADADGVSDCIDEDSDGDGIINEDDCAPNDNTKWQSISAYVDNDRDGYGFGVLIEVCTGEELPSEYTLIDGDCDDFNDQINPDISELCNGIDDDCNGTVDDNFQDLDGDGIASCVDTDETLPDPYVGSWLLSASNLSIEMMVDFNSDSSGYNLVAEVSISIPQIQVNYQETVEVPNGVGPDGVVFFDFDADLKPGFSIQFETDGLLETNGTGEGRCYGTLTIPTNVSDFNRNWTARKL